MVHETFERLREQLRHWQSECELAKRAGDAERVARCERSVEQCEAAIQRLKTAERGAT
jgi:hypothetical protein